MDVFSMCKKAVHMQIQCDGSVASSAAIRKCTTIYIDDDFTISQDTKCGYVMLSQCPILCASEIYQVLSPVLFQQSLLFKFTEFFIYLYKYTVLSPDHVVGALPIPLFFHSHP